MSAARDGRLAARVGRPGSRGPLVQKGSWFHFAKFQLISRCKATHGARGWKWRDGRKEQAEQTREAILAAAEQVFYERGVSRASLEEISRVAGVTRGAV